MDINSLQVGYTLFSKVNPLPIIWAISQIVRAKDGDIVFTIINTAKSLSGPCSIASGDKVRLYMSEVKETMTDNFFKSAQYTFNRGNTHNAG
jgi:hypothetical protein